MKNRMKCEKTDKIKRIVGCFVWQEDVDKIKR